MRSRVTPGWSATSASRVRVSALNSVDLPTLGRPAITTIGSAERLISRDTGLRGGAYAPGRELAVDIQYEQNIADDQRRACRCGLGRPLARDEFAGIGIQPVDVALVVGHRNESALKHGPTQAATQKLLVAPAGRTAAPVEHPDPVLGIGQYHLGSGDGQSGIRSNFLDPQQA